MPLFDFGFISANAGDAVDRSDIHQAVSGNSTAGISTSAGFGIINCFSTEETGATFGYIDRWMSDGYYHYTGEGQSGDQEMTRGNKAIRDHTGLGRDLFVWHRPVAKMPFTLLGKFEYVDHYTTDAVEIGSSNLRKVFVFRLRPINAVPPTVDPGAYEPPAQARCLLVETEAKNSERYETRPNAEPTENERREAALQDRFELWWRRVHNQKLRRLRIEVPGEARPLFTDLWDAETKQIIEAKGTVTREAIRMLVGQVLDYERLIGGDVRRAALLPSMPRQSLFDLMQEWSFTVYVETEGDFVEHPAS